MKYIVEFEDEPCMYEDEVHFYKCIQAPWWGLSERVIEQLTPYQPDHTADVSKKVSISCDHENDVISRKMAIEALARMMPRSCTPDGSHPADEEIFKAQEIYVDCIESIEILPAVQPEIIHCKDCKHWRDDHTCHEHSLVSPMCANEYCSRAERRTDERFDRQTGGD